MNVVHIGFEVAADTRPADDTVFEKEYQSVYKQLISFLYSHPKFDFSFSFTGTQLSFYRQNHPEVIKILSELTERHQVEVLGGGYYYPVLPLLFPIDRTGQIEKLTSELRATIGKRPRGITLFESIWDPSLVTTIQSCGMEYVHLDSTLIPENKNVFCPLISSEQGKTIKIIPTYKEFKPLAEEKAEDWFKRIKRSVDKKSGKNNAPLVSMVFTAQEIKFLLDSHFFDEVQQCIQNDLFTLTIAQVYLKDASIFLQSYIPAGMDWEIAQWAQKPYTLTENKSRFPITIHDFLNAYPENHRLYERMMYLSILLSQCHGDKVRKSTAREKSWQAQTGIFYVCSPKGIPAAAKLRQEAYHALNEAERIIRECEKFSDSITSFDYNGDGLNEYVCQMEKYNSVISPTAGSILELDVLKAGGNYADSLNRIETFDSVQDNYARGLFVEHLLELKDKDKYSKGLPTGSGIFSSVIFEEKKFDNQRNEIQLEGRGEFSSLLQPVSLKKNIIVTPNGFTIQYILKNESPLALKAFFIVESNLAQTEFDFDAKCQYDAEIIVNGARKQLECGRPFNAEDNVSVIQITDVVDNTSFVFEPNEDCGFSCNQMTFKRPDGSGKNSEASHTFSIGLLWDVDLAANMEMEKTISLTIVPAKKNKSAKK